MRAGRVDGASTRPRHRDAVDAAVRASARLVREPRQFRDCMIPHRSDLVRLTGGDLDGENRTRIMVCITMDSHGRDIVQKLIREKVSDATEFQWQVTQREK